MGSRCAGCPDPSCEDCGGAEAEKEPTFTKCKECGSLIAHECDPDLVVTLHMKGGGQYPLHIEGIRFVHFLQDWRSFRTQKHASAQMILLTHPAGAPQIGLYMDEVDHLRAVPLAELENIGTLYSLRFV